MSRAFLPIQPPHHACMNEGGRTGRNGGRMPANERRSRECRPAEQRNARKARVQPCGAEKRPQGASAALRSRRSTSKPRELHHGIKKLQAARTRLSKQKKPLMIHLRF